MLGHDRLGMGNAPKVASRYMTVALRTGVSFAGTFACRVSCEINVIITPECCEPSRKVARLYAEVALRSLGQALKILKL
jgi:hypothetical protein